MAEFVPLSEEEEQQLVHRDGYSAAQVFQDVKGCLAYTYDDIILLPGNTTSAQEAAQHKCRCMVWYKCI